MYCKAAKKQQICNRRFEVEMLFEVARWGYMYLILPALRVSLHFPTFGGYIKEPCTRLRHVSGSKGQCWGQISYARWFNSSAIDRVTSLCC